ncbi:hypothetical protein CJO92_22910 (plasmid) [Ralstonia solanacearum]|uniref:Uncharacterized protein n=1 Tax=Ralstonia solanacearum TaxID=305 RepID=A0AAD0WIN3_RALSL|nr:hypothetical protein CJO77_22895 [Ralstonia solanacearum]AXW55483.1 hypothetical protein CJO92_22910 [Ralstonia solanacearum]CBJ35673.1 hypothethical protein [Ralstonia solanacearum PSI07]
MSGVPAAIVECRLPADSVNNEAALKVWLSDKRSAGNAMTMAFPGFCLAYRPAMAPDAFYLVFSTIGRQPPPANR